MASPTRESTSHGTCGLYGSEERLYGYISCAGAGAVAEHQLQPVGDATLSWVGLGGQRVRLDFESAEPIHGAPEQHKVVNTPQRKSARTDDDLAAWGCSSGQALVLRPQMTSTDLDV
jgi:hypothetical protein